MKISTKGRYGLRAMVDLSIYSTTEHVALKHVAERQKISEGYLEQVFSTLKKAGLVKSVKGAQGGYSLGDKAANITVGMILRTLEGNISVIDGKIDSEDGENCIEHCLKTNVWDRIDESINAVVDEITLEDLAEEFEKMDVSNSLMYYI